MYASNSASRVRFTARTSLSSLTAPTLTAVGAVSVLETDDDDDSDDLPPATGLDSLIDSIEVARCLVGFAKHSSLFIPTAASDDTGSVSLLYAACRGLAFAPGTSNDNSPDVCTVLVCGAADAKPWYTFRCDCAFTAWDTVSPDVVTKTDSPLLNTASELREVGLETDRLRMRYHGPGDPPRTMGEGSGVIRGMCSIPGEEVTELGENSKEFDCDRRLALGLIGTGLKFGEKENGTFNSDALVGVKGDSGWSLTGVSGGRKVPIGVPECC